MSDQSKPTTGEWTARRVMEYFPMAEPAANFGLLSDAINAALAKLHRRAQLAEAALPEWKEISKATAGQATGRFFPALLRYALTQAEEENAELRAVLIKYQTRYHGAPHAQELWERAQKILSGPTSDMSRGTGSDRASSEVNGIGTQLERARANANQQVTDSSPAQEPSALEFIE